MREAPSGPARVSPGLVIAAALWLCAPAAGQHVPVQPVDPTHDWKLADGPAPTRSPRNRPFKYTRFVFPGPARARYPRVFLYVYFLGYNPSSHEVFLNGVSLARETWDDIEGNGRIRRILYADLTPHLRGGDNCLAVEFFDGKHADMNEIAARIEGQSPDGRWHRLMVIDERWRTSQKAAEGWKMPGFDDNAWRKVGAIPFPSPLGYFSVLPGLTPVGIVTGRGDIEQAEALFKTDGRAAAFAGPPAQLVLDFGRTLTGVVRLTGKAAGGAKLRLTCCEAGNLAQPFRSAEVLLGKKMTARVHPGLWTGRFVKVEVLEAGSPVEIDAVTFDFYHYPVAHIGSFECSDKLLNQVWECGAFSTHMCMQNGYVDGALVERGMWIADFFTEMWANWAAFGDRLEARYTLDRFGKGRRNPYMQYGMMNNDLIWVLALADYLRHTGDAEFARGHVDTVRSVLALSAEDLNEHGMWTMEMPMKIDGNRRAKSLTGKKIWPWIDWGSVAMGGELGGTQALYVWALREAAWILDELGAPGSADLRKRADRAAEALNARLWDAKAGLYADCRDGDTLSRSTSVQVNVLAVLSGAADEKKAAGIYERLLRPKDFAGCSTPYFTCYVLLALSRMAHDERALDLARSYYGDMVRRGATTFWEGHNPKGNDDIVKGVRWRSKSHAWGAGVTYWLTSRVLGVRPLEPGYRTLLVAPNLLDLSYVRGEVPTPYGTVGVDWPSAGKPMKVRLPAGVTAYAGPAARASDPKALTRLVGPGEFRVPMR